MRSWPLWGGIIWLHLLRRGPLRLLLLCKFPFSLRRRGPLLLLLLRRGPFQLPFLLRPAILQRDGIRVHSNVPGTTATWGCRVLGGVTLHAYGWSLLLLQGGGAGG